MNSPPHRANILNGDYEEIGLGIALGTPAYVEPRRDVHDRLRPPRGSTTPRSTRARATSPSATARAPRRARRDAPRARRAAVRSAGHAAQAPRKAARGAPAAARAAPSARAPRAAPPSRGRCAGAWRAVQQAPLSAARGGLAAATLARAAVFQLVTMHRRRSPSVSGRPGCGVTARRRGRRRGARCEPTSRRDGGTRSCKLSDERLVTRWAHPARLADIHRTPHRARPGASARLRFFTEDGFPEVYLLLREYTDRAGRDWVQIRVPKRPNGAVGWVPRDALGPFNVTRYQLDRQPPHAARDAAAEGPQGLVGPRRRRSAGHRARRPGHFWVREKFRFKNTPVYGTHAIGTSAYAPTLTDWPGGGRRRPPRDQPARADPRAPVARLHPRPQRGHRAALAPAAAGHAALDPLTRSAVRRGSRLLLAARDRAEPRRRPLLASPTRRIPVARRRGTGEPLRPARPRGRIAARLRRSACPGRADASPSAHLVGAHTMSPFPVLRRGMPRAATLLAACLTLLVFAPARRARCRRSTRGTTGAPSSACSARSASRRTASTARGPRAACAASSAGTTCRGDAIVGAATWRMLRRSGHTAARHGGRAPDALGLAAAAAPGHRRRRRLRPGHAARRAPLPARPRPDRRRRRRRGHLGRPRRPRPAPGAQARARSARGSVAVAGRPADRRRPRDRRRQPHRPHAVQLRRRARLVPVDSGYDCSGSVSYLLHGGGLLHTPLDSGQFMSWGSAGRGRWITIYANPGHAYAIVRTTPRAAALRHVRHGRRVALGRRPALRRRLRRAPPDRLLARSGAGPALDEQRPARRQRLAGRDEAQPRAAAAQRVGRRGHRLEADEVRAGRGVHLRAAVALLEPQPQRAVAAGEHELRRIGQQREEVVERALAEQALGERRRPRLAGRDAARVEQRLADERERAAPSPARGMPGQAQVRDASRSSPGRGRRRSP